MTNYRTALDSHVCDMTFELDQHNEEGVNSDQTIAVFYLTVRPKLEEALEELTNNHIEWKIHSCLDVEMIKGKRK